MIVIEWLQFQIETDWQEVFLQKDTELWTAALSQYPGFLRKEVWIDPHDHREVTIVIHWATYEQWKSIPTEDLESIERQFQQHLPKESYTMIYSRHYQVLDSDQTSA